MVNFLQELYWWVLHLILRVKYIDLNNFKIDVLSEAIELSRIDLKYTRDGKGGLIRTKYF